MKSIRILSVIMLVILCLELIACSNNDTPKTDKPQNIPAESTTSEEYLFLKAPTEGFSPVKMDFANSSLYGLYTSKNKEIAEIKKSEIKKIPIDSQKEFTYSHSDCKLKSSESNEFGSYYSVYDVYTNGQEKIAYLRGTDLICYYMSLQSGVPGVTVKVDNETAAKEVADKFLLEILPQGTLEKYDDVNINSADAVFMYIITYRRSVEGYKSDETISVYIDKSGKLVGYNGYNVKKYDALVDRIDKIKLDNAKQALTEKLGTFQFTNLKLGDPTITTDTEGNIYIEIRYTFENSAGIEFGDIALVNVK